MIRIVCDTCGQPIDLDQPGWFGVDHVEPDETGEIPTLGEYHKHHFCTSDHLIAWVMDISYTTAETT